jgi:predicted MFS family arabinose efflux permease
MRRFANPALEASGTLWPLFGTLGIQVVAAACTLAFPVLSPAIPGTEVASIGTYLGLVYVGAMVGSFAGGALVDRHGPIRASQWALVLQATSLILLTAPVPGSRMFGALVCGLGYGPITPASSKILARITSADRMSFVFSFKQTGVPLGGLAAGALLPGLSSLFGWRVAFWSLAALTVGVACICTPLRNGLDEPKHASSTAPGARALTPVLLVLRSPTLRMLAVLSLLFSAVQLCVSGYLTAYLLVKTNVDLVRAGLIYAAAQAAGIAGRLMWGHLADCTRSSRGVLIVVAVLMTASALCTSVISGAWTMPAVCLTAMCFGATAIGWNGVYLGEVARLSPPGQVATVTGGALFFTYIGVVVGPPAFGWLVSYFGNMSSAFIWLAALPLFAVFLLLLPRPDPVLPT